MSPASTGRLVRDAAAALVLLLLWQTAGFAFLEMPPAAGIAWLLLVTAAFLYRQLRGGPGSARRRARLRLRGPGLSLAPVVGLVPPLALLKLSLLLLAAQARLLPPPAARPGPLAAYAADPLGLLAVLLLVIGYGPLVEEFAFRGRLQGRMERALGAGPAVGLTALLFAGAHGAGAALVPHLCFGLLAGYVVWATRSLWSGVLLHALGNASVSLLERLLDLEALLAWSASHGGPALPLAGLCAAALGIGRCCLRVRDSSRRAPTLAPQSESHDEPRDPRRPGAGRLRADPAGRRPPRHRLPRLRRPAAPAHPGRDRLDGALLSPLPPTPYPGAER